MATVNIRVDDALKRDTEGILSELGLSISAATTLFYKQVVRYGGIPLDLKVDYPNAKTLEALKESEQMIIEKTSRNFSSLADMRKAMSEENEKEDE
ncbi:MAG: type II toxin-antitoxin system RelB/DinJ family antitoxin [Oscillospiraceae bacterium]|nr:type II toxin-antitoxin system RelB/DinJ family antitoxin [Oscillospiraceae bacterium]